ncbi:arf-GAP with Rho-GAP domain, ANK repeat and PH domain-containing protein 1 [Pyxicephalus adspersus]|uniref:arf-GAP with Rho-GAP domain, ANK repeat and PH domain-containing protein 1 n=1 Tax=Pyxicephalus adspersus TaxID=30357 RepID=UPI003B5C80D2
MMSDTSYLSVSEWLQTLKLDLYSDLFEKHDFHTVSDLRHLSDDFLLHMGIQLPGHRKRILASLHKSVPQELENEGGRPIPKKRSIFVTTSCQPECPVPNVEPAAPPEPRGSTKNAHVPPPIPPRVTRVPPLKFSTTPPKSVSPISLPESYPAEETPCSPTLASFCPSPFTPDVFGYTENNEHEEEPPKVAAPPLPLKRHKLPERKSRTPPPLPVRPRKPSPPLPSSPPPATDETKLVEDQPSYPTFSAAKPLPCVLPRDPPTTPVQPPPRDGFFKPEIMESDMGNIYEFHKDIGGIALTGYRRLRTEDDVTEGSEDYDDAQCFIGSDSDLSTQRSSSSLSSGISSGNMEDGEPQYTTVIKAGWLDKNPPQGSYIFQKRWVKLDTDYLRYYDSDKDMYSKRMIRTSAIAKVASMGDQKFEVATSNRNFMFRAESDGERNDWVRAVQQILDERKMKVPCNPTLTLENPDKCGPLEMKGCKPKLFVAVAADKVYLYKNAEDYCSGVGITSIDMNVGNVKEVDKKSFDLTTPYKTFSFVAESEQERGDWVEAMMQSVAGALSNPEVAKKIWSVEANRRCADCDAPNPEWASINLCVVICKKCAGEHRSLGPNISKVRSLKMDNKIWTDELIQALCVAVTSSDLTETQALVFCGADISCTCGDEFFSQPLDLAQQSGQRLQEEFLKQNRTSETPRLDLGTNLEKQYYIMQHSITHNGYLYKTSSMAKLVTDRKAKEEFSRRWCVLNDGVLSYYETNHSSSPNGEIRMDEIVCVAVIPPETHGYDSTFEIYTKSERLYLFAADKQEEAREWVKSITKCFLPPKAEELLSYDFDRIGRLQFKGGRSLERSMVGWFSLCKTNLYTYVEEKDMVEVTNLKKLSELSTKDKDILVLGEKGRITYMQGERKLDFSGWVGAIQKASSTSGDTLSEQQLTNSDVPFIVDKCIEHISRFGVESEGIYRKSGQKSKITNLLEALKKDARSVVFKEEEPVDNVSDTLKRFFREIGEGIFAEHCRQWLHVTGEKMMTMTSFFVFFFSVQHFSDVNQMNVHNLAIVFGPTLFQTDGQNYKPGRVVEDLINFYQEIFNVSTQEIQKQLDIFYKIMKLRSSQTKPRGTDFICSVYLREKKPECEQSVHIAVTMTAQELMETLLERRNICPKDGEYWSCVEVDTTEEIERPLHFSEKVLPVFHTNVSSSTHLIVKEDPNMDAMLFYIKNRVGDSKNGMMKFREDKSLLDFTMKFHDRYFMLNSSTLRMYREIRSLKSQKADHAMESHRPEKEWAVKNLTIYLGIKKKIMRAPTGWGFTIMSKNEKNEKSQWYLCCETVGDMREWLAAFTYAQYGSLWPEESTLARMRNSRQDPLLGNRSLIPIRGSEMDIRRSMAAFTADPLTVSSMALCLSGTLICCGQ